MYYKIVNKDSQVYMELRSMREKEIQMDEDNKKSISENIPYKWDKSFGMGGQQNMWRVCEYTGFCFNDPEKVDGSVWKKHKDYPDVYIPNKRTKAGKTMAKFLQELKRGRFWDVWEILDLIHIGKFTFPYVEIVDEVLLVYLDDKQIPKDSNIIEITRKEFYSLLNQTKL